MIETIIQYAKIYSDPPERIRPSARGIIIKDNKILLSHELNTGVYMTPGGGLEEGETLQECCVRELREETGYEVIPIKPFVTVNEYSFETLYISNYFICEIKGEAKQSLTKIEIEHGITPEWVDINDAIRIFSVYDTKPQDIRSLYLREFTVLNKFLSEN